MGGGGIDNEREREGEREREREREREWASERARETDRERGNGTGVLEKQREWGRHIENVAHWRGTMKVARELLFSLGTIDHCE